MALALSIKMEATLVTDRSHKQIMNLLNREVMETIRDKYWPKHFENVPETYPGGGGYRYAKRSEKYTKMKAKTKGHNRPLVFRGRLKQTLRVNSKITSTANNGRLKARGYFPLTAQRRREIEVVSNREQQELAKYYHDAYIDKANSPEFARKRAPKRRKS